MSKFVKAAVATAMLMGGADFSISRCRREQRYSEILRHN